MNPRFKTVLTAMVVVVLMAIYVVGIFLLWDVFNVRDSLDGLMETDLYAKEYSPDSPVKVEIAFDGKPVTASEELLLGDWFTYIYAGLGAKKTENIARFYITQANSELFDELAFSYETALAARCPIDLSFGSCALTLNIRRRHAVPKSDKVEIDLTLTGTLDRQKTGRPAVIRGENHSFVLDLENKKLRIEEHTSDAPAYLSAMNGLDRVLAANHYSRSDLNYTFFPKYTAPALEMLLHEADTLELTAPDISAYPAAEYSYDRSTAANNAINGFRSSGAFTEYDENDANFISRCLFESGIPMDSQGSRYDQWKWYDEEINTERKKTGCSASWFDRSAFFRYIRDNEGFGMSACQTSAGGGEIGDIIQLMQDGEPIAQYMITGVMKAYDGTVKDYLLSNDRYSSVSFITLGRTDFRVIHIVGYNTANI